MEFVWKCPPDQIPTDRTRGPRDTTKLSESPCVSSSGLLLATCRKSVRSCKQPGSVCFVVWNLLARSSSSSTRVCPFSVCSHARAPSSHHRRRGHESSHTLRWYWWGWMDGWCGWWQKDTPFSVVAWLSLDSLITQVTSKEASLCDERTWLWEDLIEISSPGSYHNHPPTTRTMKKNNTWRIGEGKDGTVFVFSPWYLSLPKG